MNKTLEMKANKLSIDTLNRLIYDKCKFVPWVGSGISKPNNLPLWGEWVKSVYQDIYCEDLLESDMSNEFKLGKYSKILNSISNENPNQFKAAVRNSFGLKLAPSKSLGPLNKITLINDSLIVTTNIDELIEHYLDFNCVLPSEDEKIKKITNGNSSKSVIKLHGTYCNTESWILTEKQYNQKYSTDTFIEIAEIILNLGHFLFLGTSFIGDKPSELLRIMTKGKKFPKEHFVFVPIKESIDLAKILERRKSFIEINIYPIFYQLSDDDRMHAVLSDLIEHFFSEPKQKKITTSATEIEQKENYSLAIEPYHNFSIAVTTSEGWKSTISSNEFVNYLRKQNFDFAFLVGDCGDGKTAFLQKISEEMKLNFVSLENKDFTEFRDYAKKSITFEKFLFWLNIDQQTRDIIVIDSLDEFFKVASPGELASYFNTLVKNNYRIIFGVRKNTLTYKYFNNSLLKFSSQFIYQIWNIPKLKDKTNVESFLQKFGRDKSTIEKAISINNISNKSRIDYIILSELIENTSIDYNHTIEAIQITKYVELVCEKLLTEKGVTINVKLLYKLAFSISMGDKIQCDSSLAIINPEFKDLNNSMPTLISSGLLIVDKDDFVIFKNLKITEACSAKFFIDSIIGDEYDKLLQPVIYFSKDFYSNVSKIILSRNITVSLIRQMIWLQKNKKFKDEILNEVQFHLACSFTFLESKKSIPYLREWWENTNFNRVKQKLAEALYLAGDKETMREYLNSLINNKDPNINHDTTKGIAFSTFVHFGRRYRIDDQTYQLITKAYIVNSKARKYLASILARTNRTEALPLLLESLDWVDVTGRQKIYVIDSIGYLATKDYVEFLRIKREQEKDNYFQIYYQSAIEQINSRFNKSKVQ